MEKWAIFKDFNQVKRNFKQIVTDIITSKRFLVLIFLYDFTIIFIKHLQVSRLYKVLYSETTISGQTYSH